MSAVESDYGEPTSFREAWDHPDPESREKWREAIRKEFHDMINKGVWRYVRKGTIPGNKRLIGCKWVFKVKSNGVYRARLVALGYSQVPGIDYTDNFAPVVNDATLRILLLIYLQQNYYSEVIDVETAFLYGILEEEIYMKCPEGLQYVIKVDGNLCLKLIKSIYGLVQAARQWWKEFVKVLTEELKFTKSEVDPCLLFKKSEKGMMYLCLYVDDVLCIGDKQAVLEGIQGIKSKFAIKQMGQMHDYVGAKIIPTDENSIHILQPALIKKMENAFKEEIKNLVTYATPGAPNEALIRPTSEDVLISTEEQTKFRSGVGMLLYLIKHSRPDISNSVRELAKVMDGATKYHMKKLYRTIKYVVDTKNFGLFMKPTTGSNEQFIIKGICDSDFAGDKDTRISVTGYVVYVNGVLISWKSRGQKGVTLSSTEAEYVALSELCTEIVFIKMLIESMGISVELPIHIYIDNVGAMFLANNSTTGQRTKHIDTRYHYVRGLINDKIVTVEFIPTKDNEADIFTKNVGGELFVTHTEKFMQQVHYEY
jgi:hypothetical protein